MEIIIVGAGIAGLSLALALARSSHRVVVLEAAPALAEKGAGVQMTPLGMRYLFQWGMRDDIRAVSIVPEEMFVRDGASGDVLAAIPTGAMEERYGGAPYIVVHRAVLHDLLHRHAVRAGAELRLDSRVIRYDFAAGAVELHNGTRLAADLVLGADGINSFSRRQLLGDANVDARSTGLAALRAMAEVAQMKADPLLADLADLETYSSHVWIAPGRSVMAYLIKEATLFNVVLSHPDDIDMSKFTPEDYRAFAQDLVKDFEPRVRRLIDSLLPKMQNFPVHSVPPLSQWAHDDGRFALIGDAAHAMAFYLSMGVSLAVEDAVSLTTVLDLACPAKEAAVDHDKLKTALKAFEHARKERVRVVQDASLHGGHMLHVEDAAAREKVYAAMKTDGLKDDTVSEATLATESLTYGLADQRVRDWCFAYDPVKYIEKCYKATI